jgi:hypothetical protein
MKTGEGKGGELRCSAVWMVVIVDVCVGANMSRVGDSLRCCPCGRSETANILTAPVNVSQGS